VTVPAALCHHVCGEEVVVYGEGGGKIWPVLSPPLRYVPETGVNSSFKCDLLTTRSIPLSNVYHSGPEYRDSIGFLIERSN